MTASVPWWRDLIDNEWLFTMEVAIVAQKVHALWAVLAEVLYRLTLLNAELGNECYYSKSTSGSTLARHMNEQHEDLKGAKGRLLLSQQSTSWLIYLSDKGWNLDRNGGRFERFISLIRDLEVVRMMETCRSDGCRYYGSPSLFGNLVSSQWWPKWTPLYFMYYYYWKWV